MVKAIRIHEAGGPDVLRWEDVEVGAPGPGQVRVRQTAVAVNYIDTYQRSGLYPMKLPGIIGNEASGVVEAVGPGVTGIKEGDRIAYPGLIGAYVEARILPADKVVRIPEGIEDRQAAAMMIKGMTAEYLLFRTYAVQKGETILIHAAAGGVGLIVCQWAKHIGATVIGTVSTDEKAALARAHGCDHAIIYTRENFVERVKEITGGKMLPVVYDSVGATTFMDSLKCLRPRGLMVSFGQSSGKIPPIDVGVLAAHGSLYLTRPTLVSYTLTRPELEEVSGHLFGAVRQGIVKVEINHTYALKDAAQAHRDLEGRKTTGSCVLTV
ncbi:MAG: quinone oxidoreductase family protein [Alphaproteobacteria bacterium]